MKNLARSISFILISIEVNVAAAQPMQQKQPTQAQQECEKAAREAAACGPNSSCSEGKLKDAERWCIQWIRENAPMPSSLAKSNSQVTGFMEKQ